MEDNSTNDEDRWQEKAMIELESVTVFVLKWRDNIQPCRFIYFVCKKSEEFVVLIATFNSTVLSLSYSIIIRAGLFHGQTNNRIDFRHCITVCITDGACEA